jgi:dTDP-4-amino-4,6-dideoxygalactose transaminase
MINVTKPFLPPIEEFQEVLSGVWNRGWLTNNGPLVNELEVKLKEYLNVDNVIYLNNGTIALQIAIKALDLKGEIITTPFSYIATTSSIVWEGCKPIFADIDAKTLNIDPLSIEKKVTSNTSGILATHVYGNPCDIDQIEKIAKKYNLKVIYDASHCFGTLYRNKSIFSYGDISTTSFHATKVFHTVEGGAIFTSNQEIQNKVSSMRNFGHSGPKDFEGVGINGKNSEIHAAMGIVNLRYIKQILEKRRHDSKLYDFRLKFLKYQSPELNINSQFNYAYYPIILSHENELLHYLSILNAHKIFPRRYFYPSLSSINYVDQQVTPVSDDLSSRVLCLPLYFDLNHSEIEFISRILIKAK